MFAGMEDEFSMIKYFNTGCGDHKTEGRRTEDNVHGMNCLTQVKIKFREETLADYKN